MDDSVHHEKATPWPSQPHHSSSAVGSLPPPSTLSSSPLPSPIPSTDTRSAISLSSPLFDRTELSEFTLTPFSSGSVPVVSGLVESRQSTLDAAAAALSPHSPSSMIGTQTRVLSSLDCLTPPCPSHSSVVRLLPSQADSSVASSWPPIQTCATIDAAAAVPLRANPLLARNHVNDTCDDVHAKPQTEYSNLAHALLPLSSSDLSDCSPSPVVRLANIAQLEATAERLSTSGSIEHAIRELHHQLKRSDSQSSQACDGLPVSPITQIARQMSNSGSIIDLNSAARHGGYSPAGYYMSPAHSLTGTLLSKAPLQNHLSQHPAETNNSNLSAPASAPAPVPSTDAFYAMLDLGCLQRPVSKQDRVDQQTPLALPHMNIQDASAHPRRVSESLHSKASVNIAEQNQDAFGGFDGDYADSSADQQVQPHLPESAYEGNLTASATDEPSANRETLRRLTERPKSFFDPGTNAMMLYYPAPVPRMLNLPKKLSRHPKPAARGSRQLHPNVALPDKMPGSWLPDIPPSFSTIQLPSGGESDRQYSPVHSRQISVENTKPRAPVGAEPMVHSASSPKRSILEKRKSRLGNLPPQLRASTFFDPPAETPDMEIQNGSAMATLDGLLDASCHAPVNVFTDHLLAGKLGSEVYGSAHRRSSVSLLRQVPYEHTSAKARNSVFSLFNWTSSEHMDKRDGADELNADFPVGAQIVEPEAAPTHDLDPDDNDDVAEDQVESHDDEIYQGPPTTLLAELQLRKHQQKRRTMPIHHLYPDGAHATLLQLDAVAETQRRRRQSRHVNLAWEDPLAPRAGHGPAEDDDDIPLGLIRSQRAANASDPVAEMARPLGLLERRELEENEPLSLRRDRLRGHPRQLARHSMLMHAADSLWAHRSAPVIAPTTMIAESPALSPGFADADADPLIEKEHETLAQRRDKLSHTRTGEGAFELPRSRPVSGAFSAELLSQFGDDTPPPSPASKKPAAAPPKLSPLVTGAKEYAEEEETLGQRRRRLLQAQSQPLQLPMLLPQSQLHSGRASFLWPRVAGPTLPQQYQQNVCGWSPAQMAAYRNGANVYGDMLAGYYPYAAMQPQQGPMSDGQLNMVEHWRQNVFPCP